MKKKLSVVLSLAAAATLSLSSCQKELEQVSPAAEQSAAAAPTQSKGELLSAAPWHLTDLTSTTVASTTPPDAGSVSLLARLKPWVRDNVFTYTASGTFTTDEGALKIHPQAPQMTTGTWKLSEAGDSLTVTQDRNVRRYGVAELSAGTLRLTRAESGTTYTNVYAH